MTEFASISLDYLYEVSEKQMMSAILELALLPAGISTSAIKNVIANA